MRIDSKMTQSSFVNLTNQTQNTQFYMSKLSLRSKLLKSRSDDGEAGVENTPTARETPPTDNISATPDVQVANNTPVRYTVIDVVRNKLLRMYSMIMCLLWLAPENINIIGLQEYLLYKTTILFF